MANCSPARGDPTDLIAQDLAQSLFDIHPKVDMEIYANRAAETAQLRWPALVQDWVKNRVQNTRHRPLHQYVGSYQNSGFKLVVEIRELEAPEVRSGPSPELLSFKVNSLSRQLAKLRHHHNDTWTFIPDSRDDAVRKGMEGFLQLSLLLMSFVADEHGAICGLDWDLQGGVCEGPAPRLGQAVAPVHFQGM